jgi:hypothetical protein
MTAGIEIGAEMFAAANPRQQRLRCRQYIPLPYAHETSDIEFGAEVCFTATVVVAAAHISSKSATLMTAGIEIGAENRFTATAVVAAVTRFSLSNSRQYVPHPYAQEIADIEIGAKNRFTATAAQSLLPLLRASRPLRL